MSEETVTEVAAPEITAETVIPPSELDAWMEGRKEARFAEANPHVQPEQEEAAAPEVEESPPEAKAEEPEPQSRAARRLIEKERKLRADQDTWRTEQADKLAQLDAYEKARENATLDPRAHLEALGLDKEAQLDLARIIFFEENPEMATPETEARIKELKTRRWQKDIEKKLEPKVEEKPAELELNEFGIPKAHEPYLDTLKDFATEAQAEEYPLITHYKGHGEAESNEILGAMYNAALSLAKERDPKGPPPTPKECMAEVEKRLTAQRDKLVTQEKQLTPEPKIEATPTRVTLDNSIGRLPPTQPVDDNPLSDAARARRRARAHALLEGG